MEKKNRGFRLHINVKHRQLLHVKMFSISRFQGMNPFSWQKAVAGGPLGTQGKLRLSDSELQNPGQQPQDALWTSRVETELRDDKRTLKWLAQGSRPGVDLPHNLECCLFTQSLKENVLSKIKATSCATHGTPIWLLQMDGTLKASHRPKKKTQVLARNEPTGKHSAYWAIDVTEQSRPRSA